MCVNVGVAVGSDADVSPILCVLVCACVRVCVYVCVRAGLFAYLFVLRLSYK